jgi:dipeptidyl aminopeptidase/acylaminoacyl peptidase
MWAVWVAAAVAQSVVRDDGVVREEDVREPDPALVEEIRAMLQVRSASVSDLSPDGRTMLVSTRFGDVAQVHRVASPGGARTQLTFGREPVAGGGFVPGSDDILFSRDIGGNEQYQLWRLPAAGGRPTLVTDGKSRIESAAWRDDGAQLAFNSNARNGRDFDLWLSDGRSPDTARLALERTGSWSPHAFSPDGESVLVSWDVSALDSSLWIWAPASGSIRRLTPEAPVAAWVALDWSPDGRSVYAIGNPGREFATLYRLDAETGAAEALTADVPWDVEQAALSPDGRTAVFSTNEDGWSALHRIDLRKGAIHTYEGLPRGLVGGLRWAEEADVVSVTLAGPTTNGDAWTLDPRRGGMTRWTASEAGGLQLDQLVSPEVIRYPSAGGLMIPALIYRPTGPGPHPVVVQFHGGPEGQSRPSLSVTVQALVARGIAVVQPNVRGSTGYGRAFLAMDDGKARQGAVDDIGALLDWIAAEPSLDEARVGVTGGSYGGFMSLAALVTYGERIKAGVDIVGIANFVTFLENTSPYRQDLRRVEYGDERDPDMRAFLTELSPVHHVDKLKSALFVAHGANDPRVPLSEAEQIAAAVRARGLPVWTFTARNEGHGFRKQPNIERFTALHVQFFLDHL